MCGKTSVGYGVWSNPLITISTDEWIPQLPPLNVRSGNITGTTIQLLFDNIADPFSNFGYPIASKINVTAVSNIFQQQEIQYGGPNSAIITGLNEYTNYSLSVAVGTRRGFLVFAQSILVRTDFGPPSLPPDDIFAQKINSTALRFRFELIPPDDRNGLITKYLVNIRQLNVDTSWTTYEVLENGAVKSLHIGGLEKWRDYEFTVAGCTIVCGVESAIAIIRTDQDLPEVPPANRTAGPETSTSIKVQWDVVPEGFRRGIITAYHVMYKDDTIEPPDWKETSITAPTQEVVLSTLKFFTSYSFKIAAETVKGRGNHSIEFSTKTLEDVPEVFPSNLTCINGSSSTIDCGWDQMLQVHGQVNGIIVGYRIYYNVLDCSKAELADCNENTTFVDEVTVPDLLHTISNLKNYTEYEIQIELFNSLATGPKSPKIIISTDEDIPESPPTNVEGFTMSTTSVSIYWDDVPWGTSHGIITGYVCYYRRMNDGPPADELRILMQENQKRKRRSIESFEMDDYLTRNQNMSSESTLTLTRQRRALPSGGYLYPEEAQYANASESGMIIEDLVLYQWYTLRLAAMTSKGPGPTFDLNVSCAQAVPVTGPNITIYDKFSFTELTLNWSTLSYADSQGTVLDYNIIYYPVRRNGIDLAPVDQDVTSLWFEFPTQGVELNNLEPFVTYAFQSAAQTFAGPGTFSKPFYAETCRCEKNFKAVYRNHMPYFGIENGEQIGLLKNLVTAATNLCCGNCSNGHGATNIIWEGPMTSVSELNDAIFDDTDFVLPIETDKINTYYKSRPFVGILDSPGVSVFSLKVEYLNLTNNMILNGVLILWSFVAIVALIVMALGLIMWIVQCHPLQLNRTNQEAFPDTFSHGAGAGLWWAFNTVLRIGYGDIVATGKLGRIFSIPIIAVGIAISATLIAGVSSILLAYSVQKTEGSIFSKKVVAMNESYDQLVIKRMAGIISQTAGDTEELIEVLRSKRVDRMAVDAIYAAYHSEKMSDPDVIFRGIKESGATQGIVFGGRALRLEKCFRKYFHDKKVELIERIKAIIDADKRNYADSELLDKRNAMIKYESDIWMFLIKVLGGAFLGAFIIGCIYHCRHHRTNRVMAYVITHKTCDHFYEKEARQMLKKFEEHFEKKINKIEVKHAFEREYLIKNMRKYVEWLTPDQVNKYKF
uniref:Fibronectin type-III domain-containing protein n=3 Tax=Clytia hemisphaerica TaxID=252671 RepID=A0A7M5XEM8_9CNID